MFIAVDEQKHKISITEAEPGGSYYCPICGEKLILKKNGQKKAAHFAHKPGADCADWGDMSEWHLDWQEKFPKEYREVVMEYEGEKHRADICIENLKLVIEFQHSNISKEDFHERNRFYTGLGYQLLWVFDATNKIKNVDEYRLIPNVTNGRYCFGDFFTQKLSWKRRQYVFEDFSLEARKYPHNVQISLYFETQNSTSQEDKILLGAKDVDLFEMEAYTTSRYITPEIFLKENGGYAAENEISIKDIIRETQTIQNMLKNRYRYYR